MLHTLSITLHLDFLCNDCTRFLETKFTDEDFNSVEVSNRTDPSQEAPLTVVSANIVPNDVIDAPKCRDETSCWGIVRLAALCHLMSIMMLLMLKLWKCTNQQYQEVDKSQIFGPATSGIDLSCNIWNRRNWWCRFRSESTNYHNDYWGYWKGSSLFTWIIINKLKY